jgi:hypothetical protein
LILSGTIASFLSKDGFDVKTLKVADKGIKLQKDSFLRKQRICVAVIDNFFLITPTTAVVL